MKKTVLFAALVLLAFGATSCKKGSCACIGSKDGSKIDIRSYMEDNTKDDADVCSDIKSQNKGAYAIECFKGKTLEEAEEEIKNR